MALERLRDVLAKLSREQRQEALQQLPREARGGGGDGGKVVEAILRLEGLVFLLCPFFFYLID